MAKELSIFADESGDRGGQTRYYLLTLVMHDQSDDISEKLTRYAESLRLAGFPNVLFPSEPLLNDQRGYQRHKVKNPAALSARMKRHISNSRDAIDYEMPFGMTQGKKRRSTLPCSTYFPARASIASPRSKFPCILFTEASLIPL